MRNFELKSWHVTLVKFIECQHLEIHSISYPTSRYISVLRISLMKTSGSWPVFTTSKKLSMSHVWQSETLESARSLVRKAWEFNWRNQWLTHLDLSSTIHASRLRRHTGDKLTNSVDLSIERMHAHKPELLLGNKKRKMETEFPNSVPWRTQSFSSSSKCSKTGRVEKRQQDCYEIAVWMFQLRGEKPFSRNKKSYQMLRT